MLHNPRVSPCTQYHRYVHLCYLIPRYTKYSYPKLNTINLHSLIWGDQYQSLISKLPSLGPLNLDNSNILLILFHLNEWENSDREMLLTRWSTQHLVLTVYLCSPYHFLRIDRRCWLGRGRWRRRWRRRRWWWWECDDKIFTLLFTKLFWASTTL